MPDSNSERKRIAACLRVAREFASNSSALGKELRERLAQTSGLSNEGIELALSHSLETDISEEDLALLLHRTGRSASCHVVLAGNVCIAALRAVVVATATAPKIYLRASRRDPVLSELLTRELCRDGEFCSTGSIELVSEVVPSHGDELHLYGSDETVRNLSANANGALVRAHGTGFGICAVSLGTRVGEAANAIARDVVVFDQKGCMSPRVVFVEGDARRAAEVGEALERALSLLDDQVPRGPLERSEEAEVARYARMSRALGTYSEGRGHGVAVLMETNSIPLPPPHRIVAVMPSRGPSVLFELARFVTCVAADADGFYRSYFRKALPGARFCAFGEMQRPPLDGPVDLRPAFVTD